MTATQNYNNLKSFLNRFPKWVESKADLLKIQDKSLIAEYYSWRSYFHIDLRYKPLTVINELKKFKYDNIYFKSEELGIDLTKNPAFDIYDKYTSSNKLIARTTKAMLGQNIQLEYINAEYKSIEIGYKQTAVRKVIDFKQSNGALNVEFLENMSDTTWINIAHASGGYKCAFNKNNFDFVYDYHNMSNDFANNLKPFVDECDIFIYNE